MNLKRIALLIGLVLLLLAGAGRVRVCSAADAISVDIQSGAGTSGYDLAGSLDLHPDPEQEPWETSLTFAHLKSSFITPSDSNQTTFSLSHSYDPHWDTHADFTYWRDTLNEVDYVGPTFGFTYTWTTSDAQAESSASKETTQDTSGATRGEEEMDMDADEIAAVSLDIDLFVYGTDLVSTGVIRTVRNPMTNKRETEVVNAGTQAEHTTQAHPNLTIEKPLWDQAVTPYATAGHSFYSKDPSAIEAIVGKPRFAASSNQVGSLIGGLSNNNGSIGLRIPLPLGDLLLNPSLGVVESATDLTWATVQEVTLTYTFVSHIRMKLDWSRSIEYGESSDIYTAGLGYRF